MMSICQSRNLSTCDASHSFFFALYARCFFFTAAAVAYFLAAVDLRLLPPVTSATAGMAAAAYCGPRQSPLGLLGPSRCTGVH